jgi:hypothetical protein
MSRLHSMRTQVRIHEWMHKPTLAEQIVMALHTDSDESNARAERRKQRRQLLKREKRQRQ